MEEKNANKNNINSNRLRVGIQMFARGSVFDLAIQHPLAPVQSANNSHHLCDRDTVYLDLVFTFGNFLPR